MNEDEFAALRAWGEGLRSDEREEVRAAGRAIVMLADEVERLQVALWHAADDATTRNARHEPRANAEDATSPPEETASVNEHLRRRLRRFFPERLRAED